MNIGGPAAPPTGSKSPPVQRWPAGLAHGHLVVRASWKKDVKSAISTCGCQHGPGGSEVGGGKKKVSCVGQNGSPVGFSSGQKNFVLVSCQ